MALRMDSILSPPPLPAARGMFLTSAKFWIGTSAIHIRIIAKIENREGVQNIEEILAVSDGIMVARGDMGVEIDFTEIPIIQKNIIWHCYNSGKPVITATQMLESA